MTGDTYKMIKIVGTSSESVSDAIKSAVARASETLKGISWFQVVEERGMIHDGAVKEFQVVLEVGFRLMEHPAS